MRGRRRPSQSPSIFALQEFCELRHGLLKRVLIICANNEIAFEQSNEQEPSTITRGGIDIQHRIYVANQIPNLCNSSSGIIFLNETLL